MNRISLCLFMAIKFVYFVLCHLGWGRVWTWVYDPPMTFTILSGRWVGYTGCPAKSSTKGGHPRVWASSLVRMKSEGFWRWCVIICKIVFLDFVHRLYFNKITTLRKLDLLPSSGKKERTEILGVGPPGWASNRPSTSRRKKNQFPKRCNFIEI
jgi:hypothetical protein